MYILDKLIGMLKLKKENLFVCEVIWKNILEPGRPHETLCCFIPKVPTFFNFNDCLTLTF